LGFSTEANEANEAGEKRRYGAVAVNWAFTRVKSWGWPM
jgi:hypothetical protein